MPIPDDIPPERLEAVPRELFDRLQRMQEHCQFVEATMQDRLWAEGTLQESRWAWLSLADSLRYILDGGTEPAMRVPDAAGYEALVEQMQRLRLTVANLATCAARIAMYWQSGSRHSGEPLRTEHDARIRQAEDVLRMVRAEAQARLRGRAKR